MAVLIKRYANRKLYNTETSRYITLKGIADLLEADQEVRVIDNESGEDITSVTLSQILVDSERDGRSVSGNLLQGLFERGGEVLRKRVDDASEGIEEFRTNLRRILPNRGREWVAFGPPDFESMVQNAFERVATVLDLPRRSDIEHLSERLDRVARALEAVAPDTVDEKPPQPRTAITEKPPQARAAVEDKPPQRAAGGERDV
jgi:polyhydroxyalkanoate synthesis repressor PhaR